MPSRILWLFVFVSLLVFARDPAVAEENIDHTSTQIKLVWQDGNKLLSSGRDQVGREVVRLFESVGVKVDWVHRSNPDEESQISIRVVLAGDPTYWRQAPNAMGIVFDGHGPQSSVYIFFHSIVRTLGWRPKSLAGRMLDPRKQAALSRALAKVIAHEVFHAVAPSLPHGPAGLTQAQLDRSFLLSPCAEVHPYSASVFRLELTKLLNQSRDSQAAGM
jgi:hypothetical protein